MCTLLVCLPDAPITGVVTSWAKGQGNNYSDFYRSRTLKMSKVFVLVSLVTT